MNLAPLLSWLELQPLILIVLLLLCALVAIDVFITWHKQQYRQAAVDRVLTGVKQVVDRPGRAPASDEPARMYPEGLVPLEWDGRTPRPNWNRRHGD